MVHQVAQHCIVTDILDYGCGKGELSKALGRRYRIAGFDPAIPEADTPPEPCEFVFCGDVLEHIEPECLEAVLDDLQRVVLKHGLFIVATRPAKKTLPDGRNAHLIIEPLEWWIPKLSRRFYLKSFQNFGNKAFMVLVGKK